MGPNHTKGTNWTAETEHIQERDHNGGEWCIGVSTRTCSCAWTIWSQKILWQGIGYVPGPSLNMYLGLAEAYGMYTALSFLEQYIATFLLVLPNLLTVQVYCDNEGLIDWLNQLAHQKYPCDTIQDDYPLISKIQKTIQTLQPITLQISHIKGHQDKAKLDRPLTIWETLSIKCDKRASKAMLSMPNTIPTNHLMTTIGCPHVIIDGAIQFWHLQHQLRIAASKREYQMYLQNKFLWTSSRYDSIQWTAFQQAFQWLAINEQWFISKLTHEWLPLQASHIMASASNQQHCPSCQRSPETTEHFLQCPHPNSRQGIWEEFQQGLQKLYLKHDLQQPLQDILSEGYWLSCNPMWPTPNHIICQASLQEAIQQQAQP